MHSRLKGKLTSQEFQIHRHNITFMMASTGPGTTQIQLVVDGQPQRVTNGGDREEFIMEPVNWDVKELAGKMAHLEIIDHAENGRILVDNIVFSDTDRSPEWRRAQSALVQAQATEINGRKYYFSSTHARYRDAAAFARSVGGKLATVESREEHQALSTLSKGKTLLGVRKVDGIWQSEDSKIYTHIDWAAAVPSTYHQQMMLGEAGAWSTRDDRGYFIVEWGGPSLPPTYEVTAPDENRALAEALRNMKATVDIATSERILRLDANSVPPDEPFEVWRIQLPKGHRVTRDFVKKFEFENRIRGLQIDDGTDASLMVVPHLPHLVALTVKGGRYQTWRGLQALRKGHPLRYVSMSGLQINPQQIRPIFSAAALNHVEFTSVRVYPEFGEMLASQKDSLRHISFNAAGGLGYSGFRYLSYLKKVRNANLWASGVGAQELKFVGTMTRLEDLNLGLNHGITGHRLEDLRKLQRLRKLSLWDTRVSDEGLTHLPELPALESLSLGRTHITGETLAKLVRQPVLKSVEVTETRVGDEQILQLLPAKNILRITAQRSEVTKAAIDRFHESRPGFSSDVK